MNKVYVFVEGATDVNILRPLIPDEFADGVQFVQSDGKDSMPSYARSVLALRQRPVALVMDADTTQSEVADIHKRDVLELLRMVSVSIPSTVIMAVPMIEAVYFASPRLLERAFGKPITDAQLEQARREPKRVLQDLNTAATGSGAALVNGTGKLDRLLGCWQNLTPDELLELRQHPVVRELNEFLAKVSATPVGELATV